VRKFVLLALTPKVLLPLVIGLIHKATT